jgi:serine/threonine protein phosphatase PrpC
MAYVAAVSEKGPVRPTNQDACCVEIAETPFGEVVMAIVCDGVGGLEMGELASATVVARFSRWFEEELPQLLHGSFVDFSTIRYVWSALLNELNELIQTHGVAGGASNIGTTFSGIIANAGHYLVAHVGDTRIYQIGQQLSKQITEDQTLLARELTAGKVSPKEAKNFGQKNVILQAVGTSRLLKPSFYEGDYTTGDLFVLCSDGAYRRPGSEGITALFRNVDLDDTTLQKRCESIAKQDIAHGEKDNLTIVCFAADSLPVNDVKNTEDDDQPTAVFAADLDDELVTAVYSGRDADTRSDAVAEDDLATAVFSAEKDDDLPTAILPGESQNVGKDVDQTMGV